MPLPPGPRGLPFFGISLSLRRNTLGLLQRLAHEYGDIVCFPLLYGQTRVLLNHPDFVEEVLVRQQPKFIKGVALQKAAIRLLGQGLLTSEGELWRRQRRLVQPSFHHAQLAEYAADMIALTEQHTREWRAGDVRDINAEMMALTLEIAVKTLFGARMRSEAKRVGNAVTTLMRYQIHRLRTPLKIPEQWPTPTNLRANRAYAYLDSVVFRIIDAHLNDPGERRDVLSLLRSALDEDGSQMSRQQLRDEVMTLFIAGHETTALATAWTWYLLARHPEAEARLYEELGRVLAGSTPSLDALEMLPFLKAVIHESLRLYPPAYVIQRTSLEPLCFAGYYFPANTTFIMSQWVMHRDPRYFDAPEAFRPERWLTERASRLPAYAYFPFGGGPRRCIGQGFAIMEASLLIALLAQRFRFRLVSAEKTSPEPLITLRARPGIRLRLEVR